jgi:hypothetical protein
MKNKIFIGLIERSATVLRFYILSVILLHNGNYVVDFFAHFNTAKALIFESVCGVSRLFPLCKFSWYLRCCAQECQPIARCLFANYNKCAQKDDGGYAERLSFPTRSPPYIAFSYHSKYLIYQADCRSLLRTRLRFLFFAP